jgi:hypothetical protein
VAVVYSKERNINITASKDCNTLAYIDYLFLYLDSGLAFFPLRDGKPLEGDWRKFIWKRASYKDAEGWIERHGHFDIGLPLGGINQLYAVVMPRENARTWFWSLDQKAQIDIATKTLIVYDNKDIYVVFRPKEDAHVPKFIAVKFGDKKFLGEGTFVYLPPSRGLCLWQEEAVIKRRQLLSEISPEVLGIW